MTYIGLRSILKDVIKQSKTDFIFQNMNTHTPPDICAYVHTYI